jgi:tetratricopeptide (TPR) repeat protein
VLHLLKRNKEAMTAFDKALNLDPQNPYRYSSRAYFKDRIGDLEGAIADYEKAIELDPEDAVAYNNKGLVEEKLGYQNRAKKSFKQADELVGYKPKETEIPQKPASDLPPIGNAEEGRDKLSFKNYLSTVKNVITDQKTRKEFLNFLFKKKGE